MTREPRVVEVRRNLLKQNDVIARELRSGFLETGTFVVNLVSSPGAGKTTFLERLLTMLRARWRVAALVGDLATDQDAERLRRSGVPVRQITTVSICHLDAEMIERALDGWASGFEWLLIENVGNLICPAAYDLGESAKVVLLSVTEGDEKPLKYPAIFSRAALMVLTKIDLLAYVPFQAGRAIENARRVNPRIETIELSCVSDHGLADWQRWLAARHPRFDFAEPLLV